MSKTQPHEYRRMSAAVELRADEPDTPVIVGYASVSARSYRVGGSLGWDETIAPGAFAKTLSEQADVRLLFDHAGVPLARTKTGTLDLAEDDHGLRVRAEIDPSSPLAASVVSALRRGDLDEMSIGFYAVREDWNADYTTRNISEVKLVDVSVVTFPANPATVAQMQRTAVNLDERRTVAKPRPAISAAQAALILRRNRRR